MLLPNTKAPELILPLVGGGEWSLHDSEPEAFTFLSFFRGYHCPACKRHLLDAQTHLSALEARGVKLIAITPDGEERATKSKAEWGLTDLDIAYGLTMDQAREWGLYVSKGIGTTSIGIEEPHYFNEPGHFLIRPDGQIYYVSVQNAPYGRPHIGDFIGTFDFIKSRDYPARGDAT